MAKHNNKNKAKAKKKPSQRTARMVPQLTAKDWGPIHDALLQKEFDVAPPIVTEDTTPAELAKLSPDFNNQIYKVFTYGTVANKLKKAKLDNNLGTYRVIMFIPFHDIVTHSHTS